jgi:hypothetical protein
MLYRTVSIGECLKISEVFHLRIFTGKKLFSPFQLPAYRQLIITVSRTESTVVTIDAPSTGDGSISVGTRESGIDTYFLDSVGK